MGKWTNIIITIGRWCIPIETTITTASSSSSPNTSSTSTNKERSCVKSIVATLSIKRIPDPEIIKEVYQQTHKTISRVTLFNVRKAIKKESYHWYKAMREGQYEYIHEFKERIDEILLSQKKHHVTPILTPQYSKHQWQNYIDSTLPLVITST